MLQYINTILTLDTAVHIPTESMIPELCQIVNKVRQAFCHACLSFLSISNVLFHLTILFTFMPARADSYQTRTDKSRLRPPHFLEILILLCETASHLVDMVLMLCAGLSHVLKSMLCLLVSLLRLRQQSQLSVLKAQEMERWKVMHEVAADQKQRVKQKCMP